MLFINGISILKQCVVFDFYNRPSHLEYTRIAANQVEKTKTVQLYKGQIVQIGYSQNRKTKRTTSICQGVKVM